MKQSLSDDSVDQLFGKARTYNAWRAESVSELLIRRLYDITKWAPTSANSSPARFAFLTSEAAKARLKPHLMEANRAKTMASPVVVIVGYDLKFADKFPILVPPRPDIGVMFADPRVAYETAFRNGSLQGAYLMMAARAIGLDCGPMSGFDAAAVDAEFFAGSSWRSNFICNIGYGSEDGVRARLPRLAFEDACSIL